MNIIQRDLDEIARLDREEERLLTGLERVRQARAAEDDKVRALVAVLEQRCADNPEAGAGEMTRAFAGREKEVSRSLARRSLRQYR